MHSDYTGEEAATYLKNALDLGSNPTTKTSLNTPKVDALGECTLVTHGQLWIPVTQHKTMHTKAVQ
jgi:hypothetical protein